jgi:hypothetical protein
VTTTSITAVSVSMRSDQEVSSSPDVIQRSTWTLCVSCPKPTWKNTNQESAAQIIRNDVVMSSLGRSPMTRPKRPAISAPNSGRKTMAV